MHHFPSALFDFHLSKEDFVRFRSSFAHLIKEKIPTADKVFFSTDSLEDSLFSQETEYILQIKQTLERIIETSTASTVEDECLIIPFPLETGSGVAAIITGVDPVLVKNVGDDWLVEIRDELVDSFCLVRHARIDPETGCFNVVSLYTLLESIEDYHDLHLIFIELHPYKKTALDSMLSARNCATLLSIFSENRFPVHHIGHLVFCLVCLHPEKEFGSRFGTSLLAFLRRENFKKVHIGCCRAGEVVKEETNPVKGRQQLLDGGWTALKTSRIRGPFSLYNHFPSLYDSRQLQQARSKKVVKRLQTKWKKLDSFALVQFQQDQPDLIVIIESLYSVTDPSMIVEEEGDIYVLLPGCSEAEAVTWTQNVLQKLDEDGGGEQSVSAGISCYPYVDFKKYELVENCRKALVHGAFLGPGTATVFDHISLTISGDSYFGEGDMVMALKEYKRGFVCCHTDVNLLNCLGVTYGILTKHKLAVESFKHALIVDPDNYMALYNLGLALELKGEDLDIIDCFEKALAVYSIDKNSEESKQDLLFRLGRLYCRTDNYKKAKEILLSWYEENEDSSSRDRVLRLLGESCYGLQEKEEAKTWLQRAVHRNEFDSKAMSLLGLLYLEENEGDDIALSLCRKSVELQPDDIVFRLRLSMVLTHLKRYDEGIKELRPCLRNERTKDQARLQMGIAYFSQAKKKRAAKWFEKVVNDGEAAEHLISQAHHYLEKC